MPKSLEGNAWKRCCPHFMDQQPLLSHLHSAFHQDSFDKTTIQTALPILTDDLPCPYSLSPCKKARGSVPFSSRFLQNPMLYVFGIH